LVTEPDCGEAVKSQPVPSLYWVSLSFICQVSVPVPVFAMVICCAESLSPKSSEAGVTLSCGVVAIVVVVVVAREVVVVVLPPLEVVVVVELEDVELDDVVVPLLVLLELVVVVLLPLGVEVVVDEVAAPTSAKKVRVGVLILVRVMAYSVGVI